MIAAIPLLYRVIAVIVVLVSAYGGYKVWEHRIYRQGFTAGSDAVQVEWKASVEKEKADGDAILRQAERDTADLAGDERVFSDHPWNRDKRIDAGKP